MQRPGAVLAHMYISLHGEEQQIMVEKVKHGSVQIEKVANHFVCASFQLLCALWSSLFPQDDNMTHWNR
jgi:hypothetical protein